MSEVKSTLSGTKSRGKINEFEDVTIETRQNGTHGEKRLKKQTGHQ